MRDWDRDDWWYFDKLFGDGEPGSDEPSWRRRKREYAEFMRSPEWAAKRERALERAGRRCTECGAEHRLHVHHKSYIRFGGREFDRDLTVLCEECHRAKHDFRERYLKQLRGES